MRSSVLLPPATLSCLLKRPLAFLYLDPVLIYV